MVGMILLPVEKGLNDLLKTGWAHASPPTPPGPPGSDSPGFVAYMCVSALFYPPVKVKRLRRAAELKQRCP